MLYQCYTEQWSACKYNPKFKTHHNCPYQPTLYKLGLVNTMGNVFVTYSYVKLG